MQKKIGTKSSARRGKTLSTKELTNKVGGKEQTARASVCRLGHWMGLIPVKLPNGRLRWSDEDSDRLLDGEVLQ